MNNSFVKLEQPDNLDTKGWDVDFGELLTPKRGVYPYLFCRDHLFESPDKKYACLFYTITEYRIGSESGLVAIFESKENPALLVSPTDQWFDYQYDRSLVFDKNILFLRKLASNKDESLSGVPFIVIDVDKRRFGFIDFDATSIYYTPIRLNETIFRLNLDKPMEVKNFNLANYHGYTFDLNQINYYPIKQLEECLDIYWAEKKVKK